MAQAKAKEDELLEYLKLSPTDLWNTDLDSFLDDWEVCISQQDGEQRQSDLSVSTASY